MERFVEQVTGFAAGLTYEALPRDVVHQAKRLIIDALGCGLAGLTGETARVAREMALAVPVTAGSATILGTDRQTTPDLAAFANSTAVRYLDFNDTYLSLDVCHPSDHIAPVLSAVEATDHGGRQALLGVVVAYEVHGALCDAANARARGWDQGTYGGLASAVATARATESGQREMEEALRLAAASNLSLAGTRFGTVSMWKAAATAFASRNSLFATFLARRGMTGPSRIFSGRGGFFDTVSGPLELTFPGSGDRGFRVMRSRIKRFPSGYHSQAAIEAALDIRARVGPVERIKTIALETYDDAVEIMAGDPEKWAPATRETADHSLPYVLAVALVHGAVDLEHFEDRHLADRRLRELMRKISVTATEECNRSSPEGNLSILHVVGGDEQTHTARVLYHRGHPRNPMSDGDVEAKFRRLAGAALAPAQLDTALESLWRLETLSTVPELMARLEVPGLAFPTRERR